MRKQKSDLDGIDEELPVAVKEAEGEDPTTIEALKRLDRALRTAARTMGQEKARALTDLYYQVQRLRISTANQCRHEGQPTQIFAWLHECCQIIEHDIQLTLKRFVEGYRVGQWCLGICGVGPVIAAGLLSHLDVRRAKTCGHFWSFAGLTNRTWDKGQKRPWNQRLKDLCAFKLGESFIKVQSRPADYYGKLYKARKEMEVVNTRKGLHRDEAAAGAARVDAKTLAHAFYSGALPESIWDELAAVDAGSRESLVRQRRGAAGSGVPMLPPAHLNARARRYAVKLFLSHLHHVMTVDYFGQVPPLPYSFEHSEGDHRHFVAVPNWPQDHTNATWPEHLAGDSLRQLLDQPAAKQLAAV